MASPLILLGSLLRHICRAGAAFLLLACALAQAQSLEIIQLKSRPADQVLPVIQPLLAPGGS